MAVAVARRRGWLGQGRASVPPCALCAREGVLDVVPRLSRLVDGAAEIVAWPSAAKAPARLHCRVDADSHTARAASFGAVADHYERARPGYPAEAVRWLAGEPPRDVVDLGAGTGKLTRGLVAAGHRVAAVDPSEEMLARLRAALVDVRAIRGRAEAIPLADASADVVTVAQAFHWFEEQEALREIARVLRTGGALALVWNCRTEREPWVARLSEIIGTERVDSHDLRAAIDCSALFGPVEHATFEHAQQFDRETLLDLVASRSYCATREPGERREILDRVRRTFDEAAVNGEVVLPYVVDAYRARVRAL